MPPNPDNFAHLPIPYLNIERAARAHLHPCSTGPLWIPNRTSFRRRQQAMPSRSMLAHPHQHDGPDHAPPSLILRELEGFDGGTASIATPPPMASSSESMSTAFARSSASLGRHASAVELGNFCGSAPPDGDFAGLAGLKSFVMLASFRAFAPKLRKVRLLPTHGDRTYVPCA